MASTASALPAADPTTPAIRARDLGYRYAGGSGPLLALDGLDLAVGNGEFVALVGPSGCGKSTLLRLAAGLLAPTAGELRVLEEAPAAARAGHRLGLVAQDPGLLPWRTVAGNVALSLEVTGANADIDALLGLVGIAAFAGYYPGELSGGMRQRVALARALAHGPRLLLMDEPFGALDEFARDALGMELLRIWERERVSVLFVTHSMREAVMLADRVLVMSVSPGRIVAEVAVTLPRPRRPALDETPEFAALLRVVRGAMGSAR